MSLTPTVDRLMGAVSHDTWILYKSLVQDGGPSSTLKLRRGKLQSDA